MGEENKTVIFDVVYLGSASREHRGKFLRKIELKGSQTLADLHDAIQEAMGWDDPHLYLFFVDGKEWSEDKSKLYRCPDPYAGVDFIHIDAMRKDTLIASLEPEDLVKIDPDKMFFMGDYFGGMDGFKRLKSADVLSAKFLTAGHEFLYLFDFGDEHLFSVRVVGFGEVKKGEKYPKLVHADGKAPPQYP